MEKDSALLLLSGGLDSTVLANYIVKDLNKNLTCMFFDYGQPQRDREYASAVSCVVNLQNQGYEVNLILRKIHLIVKNAEGYIPARNLVLLSYAMHYAEVYDIEHIYIGILTLDRSEEESFPDVRTAFINGMLDLGDIFGVHIHAPFAFHNKITMLRMAKAYGINLDDTWSCFAGGEERCGVCSNCVIIAKLKGELHID